ncbi:PREDICTED: PRUPE_6G193600, partial [Prunus dulcis]
VIEVGDYSNMEAPSSLKNLCRYVETTLVPEDKTLQFTIDKEVFGGERDTFLLPEDITQFAGMEEIGATVVAIYMRYLHDVLKQANMCSMVGFIDPATVTANSGTIADRSRLIAARLQKTDGHRVVDEEAKNIVNGAIKIYNSHIGRAGRKAVIWKTLSGTPKQPSSVECGYYVMRFMRDIIMDPSLAFENK